MSENTKTTYGAWVGHDTHAAEGKLTFETVEAKPADDDDVDVKVQYCGLCGTDAGSLAGGLGPFTHRVCGHEIVGVVTRVGPAVKHIKVGDVVGVGAQADSCRDCEWCNGHEEQYCDHPGWNFGGTYTTGLAKGAAVQGGFAKLWRGSARFVIPLPAGLDPAAAAPLMCGGVTMYAPLKAYGAGTTAKRVGIVGVGGLGHMGILIAKAMGAEVTAISRGEAKKADALQLGASSYIATGTGKDLAEDFKGHEGSLDLLICAINPASLPVNDYMSLLRKKGTFVLVGVVPKPLQVDTTTLIMTSKKVTGSVVGSPTDIAELLALAADKHIAPWIQKYNFDDINKALVDFGKGMPKYRFVLVNTDNGGTL